MSAAPAAPVTGDIRTRLDVWLAARRGLSRAAAHALIEAGYVRVNGRPGRPGQRVGDADSIHVDEPPPAAAAPVGGPPVEVRIVYEDEWLAVVDKPAGLVVHPAAGHPHGTLADGLRQRGDVWSLLGGADRPGIVHRLDRFTSGLLVVARTEASHRALAAQLASRRMGRTYWALVWGGLAEASGEVEAPIGRHPRHRRRMAVVASGRFARTTFRVVERCPATTVLDVSLTTGRTHQIRVHLASIGRPVVGDSVYGRGDDPVAGRPALHARRLRLLHPADGRELVVESALPDDLHSLLAQARAGLL